MTLNNVDVEPGGEEAGPPPEESSNRPFLIVAGILAGILLLSLLCIAGYAGILLPRLQSQRATQQAQVQAQNTQIAQAATETVRVRNFTSTPTKPLPTNTLKPATNTPVLAIQATNTPLAAGGLNTATLQVMQTTAAALQKSPTNTSGPTATALPTSGWADSAGAPTLMMVAIALVAIIFLARRLRTSGA